MNRPLTSDVRKNIPLSVKLDVALRMLGFTKDDQVQYDHDPALALREWDEHRNKTSGRKGEARSTSYGSDAHAIAKVRRLQKDEAAFRAKLLAKAAGDAPADRPKSKLRGGGGFSKQHRPMRGGGSFGRRT